MAVAKALVVGTCIVGLGFLLHIIGMTTTHWIDVDTKYGKGNVGLFETCSEDACVRITDLRSQDKAVQAMAILGALSGGVGVLGVIAFVILTHLGKNPISLVRMASGLLCIVAGVFIFVCVIVYGAKIYKDVKAPGITLGYSFGLSIAGGVLLLVGGGVTAAKRGSQDERFTS